MMVDVMKESTKPGRNVRNLCIAQLGQVNVQLINVEMVGIQDLLQGNLQESVAGGKNQLSQHMMKG